MQGMQKGQDFRPQIQILKWLQLIQQQLHWMPFLVSLISSGKKKDDKLFLIHINIEET